MMFKLVCPVAVNSVSKLVINIYDQEEQNTRSLLSQMEMI